MARIASQALGGFFKTQDEVRPLIYRHFAAQTVPGCYCVVDPCAGEGEAVYGCIDAVFGAKRADDVRVALCTVELEAARYVATQGARWGHRLDFSLCSIHQGDGLCCEAKGDGASLLWLNPPYDFFRGQRFESRFLDAWTPRLTVGGQLVLIVPEHALSYLSATLTTWFDDLDVLRYPEPTYAEFKQVVVFGSKRALPAEPGALPPIGDLAAEPVTLRHVPPGALTVDVNQLDVATLRAATSAWGSAAGYGRPAQPPQIGLAMRPKPAHVAMALGSGVFNGVRLSAPGRPDLLAKAVFIRRFVDQDVKLDDKGEVSKLTQVERPQLRLTILDLSTGEYRELSPGTEPSNSGAVENFADLLLAYGDGMVAAMRERCPSLHNGEEDIALPPMKRTLFPAQASAVRAALKLIARGETPLILGELGSGKTSVAIQTMYALTTHDVQRQIRALRVEHETAFAPLVGQRPLVRRVLVVCPPHLAQNWIDEMQACLPAVPVRVLDSTRDVDAVGESAAPLLLAILSRETAKLGHGIAGVAGSYCNTRIAHIVRCPRCGAPLLPSEAEKRGKGRQTCEGTLAEPLDALARLGRDMTALRHRTPYDRPSFDYFRRAALAPLLWRLRRLLREKDYSKEHSAAIDATIAAVKLCTPHPRVLRILKRLMPGHAYNGVHHPDHRVSGFAFSAKLENNTLCRALCDMGRWRVETCGEPLYQATPQPRRFPLAEYITRRYPKLFQLLVADECFVAGTLVSGRTIESLTVGDYVKSYAENGKVVYKQVKRLYKKRATSLCRVTIAGVILHCTLNHPFLTQRGWIPAGALDAEQDIVLRSEHENRTLIHGPLSLVSANVLRRWKRRLHHPKAWLRLLLLRMREVGKKCWHRQGQPQHVCREPSYALSAYDGAQSIQIARNVGDNQRGAQRQTFRTARWQRQANGAATRTVKSLEFADRNRHSDEGSSTYFRANTTMLQGGYRALGDEASHRGRWPGPPHDSWAKTRREENAGLIRTRVDRVEILEQTSDGTFGGVCPDGYVYNIEVEDTHTYFANGILVHNCHEYSTDGSAQEKALHRLTEKIPLVLPLTGSLMNGYAKSLFRNLWAVSRRMRAEFGYADGGKFAKLYGYQKRILTGDAAKAAKVAEYGASSDRVVKTEGGERMQDAPGVLPSFVLRHVLPLSVTLHKRDITPDDRVVDHDRAEIAITDAEHERNGAALGAALKAAVKRDRFDEKLAGRLFGQLAEYPSYYDRATADTGNAGPADARRFDIAYPEAVGGAIVASAEGLPAAQWMAKEEWLRAMLRRELDEGRNVLIFLWHKELADRLQKLCRSVGETPAFLDAAKVPAKKRQDWIDKNVVGKRRILITNPSCVQTGLNNLIWFASAVFVENPGCNPFVARQAVGRLDRITQTKEVRIYWPVYEGVQCAMLDLLQAKTAISQQIDGIDPSAALEMAGAGDGSEVQALDVGLAVYRYLGGD